VSQKDRDAVVAGAVIIGIFFLFVILMSRA
jgi:hypothetical protein